MELKNYLVCFLLLSGLSKCFSQSFIVEKDDESQIVLSMRLPSTERIQKTIGSNQYEDFSLLKSVMMMQKDAPELPVFSESVQVPNRGNFELEITYDGYEDFQNVSVIPSKGSLKRNVNPDNISPTIGAVYSEDAFFPGTLAQLGTPYIWRQTRGVTVSFFPYQYNPVTKTLRVYRNITAKIVLQSNQTGINERIDSQRNLQDVFAPFYQNHYANATQYQIMQEQGALLVLCPQNYLSSIEPLLAWKKEKGIETTVITINPSINNTSTSIKSIIETEYLTHPDLVYVLLVGDHEQLPTHSYGFNGEENLYSDSYYGQLEGTDFYPELLVGRFSGNVNDVQTMVQRTLEYEITPQTGNWTTNAIGIGSNEGFGFGDDGEADWQHLRNIKTKLQTFGYNTVHEFYEGSQNEGDAPGNPSAFMIVEALNQGAGLMNYTGHGWTEGISTGDFTSNSVEQLTNSGKYPFVVSVACNNGTFINSTSLCESFLCAKQGSDITGAIASCGSSILMAWAEPMQTQDEMTELIIQSNNDVRITTLGGLFYNGQLSMLEAYDQSITAVEVMQTWVLFGDPTVEFRSQVSENITAVHPDQISINGGQITIQSNVNDAKLTISQDSNILYHGLLTNNQLSLQVEALDSNENLNITLTKQNKTPYRGTILVNESLSVVDFEKGIVFFPNPTSDFIQIKNNHENLGFIDLKLIDMNGRVLIHYPKLLLEDSFSISTENLSSGMYLLSIANGEFQKNQKIMVK